MFQHRVGLGRLFIALAALLPLGAFAGGNGPLYAVPALDEFALVGLAAALGIAGAVMLWRRRK
jgi:uncharacterized membrane protein YccC